MDRAKEATRDRAPYRRAVKHPGEDEVVNVPRLTGELGAPFLAGDRLPDR
ncbi:MAG: hypothetical protein LC804_22530 [Acidobacteria bacterium]|nr:hypothetical protein [Acidobacteriota bacterium]